MPSSAWKLNGVSLALFLRKRLSLWRPLLAAKLDAIRRFTFLVLLGMLLDCVGGLHRDLRWVVLQTRGRATVAPPVRSRRECSRRRVRHRHRGGRAVHPRRVLRGLERRGARRPVRGARLRAAHAGRFFFLSLARPPTSTLFPYTTLFR